MFTFYILRAWTNIMLVIPKIYKTEFSGIRIPVVNLPKKTNDWVVRYTEEFDSRQEAMGRELEIKKKKSKKYIEWLISSVG